MRKVMIETAKTVALSIVIGGLYMIGWKMYGIETTICVGIGQIITTITLKK